MTKTVLSFITSHGQIRSDFLVNLPSKFEIKLVCQKDKDDTAQEHDTDLCDFGPDTSIQRITEKRDNAGVGCVAEQGRGLMVLDDGIRTHA